MKIKVTAKKSKKKPTVKHAARKAAQNAVRRMETIDKKKSGTKAKREVSANDGAKSNELINQNEGKRTIKRSSGANPRGAMRFKSIFDFRRDENSGGEKESLGTKLKRKFEGADEKKTTPTVRRFEREKSEVKPSTRSFEKPGERKFAPKSRRFERDEPRKFSGDERKDIAPKPQRFARQDDNFSPKAQRFAKETEDFAPRLRQFERSGNEPRNSESRRRENNESGSFQRRTSENQSSPRHRIALKENTFGRKPKSFGRDDSRERPRRFDRDERPFPPRENRFDRDERRFEPKEDRFDVGQKAFGKTVRRGDKEESSFGKTVRRGEREDTSGGRTVRRNEGENRSFGSNRAVGENRSSGENRSFGNNRSSGENRTFGANRSFGRSERENRPFGRTGSTTERKPFGRTFGRESNDSKPFGNTVRRNEGESRPFGRPVRQNQSENKPFGGTVRRNNEGENRSFGRVVRQNEGENGTFGETRSRTNDAEKRPFGKMIRRGENGEKETLPTVRRDLERDNEPFENRRESFNRNEGFERKEGFNRSERPFDRKATSFGRKTATSFGRENRDSSAPLPTVSPARKAAFEILERIEKEKAFSSALLPIYEENLKPEDRALCHEITLGVLRNQLFLDEIIKQKTDKKFDNLDLPAVLALRLALYQIYFLDRVPAYAAVDESVNLVRLADLDIAAGFVNAVLRQTLRDREKIRKDAENAPFEFEKPAETVKKNDEIFDENAAEVAENAEKANKALKKLSDKSSRAVKVKKKLSRTAELDRENAAKLDSLDQIAIETSHPHWLLRKWRDVFGAEEMTKIARANNRIPKIAFRLTDGLDTETLGILRDLGTEFVASEYIEGCFIAAKQDDYLRDFVREGKIYFQDEASQLVGKIVDLQPNESFWDVCAAPGSKLTQIITDVETRRRGDAETRREGDTETESRKDSEVGSQVLEEEIQNPKSKIQNLLVAGDLHGHRMRFLRETANLFGAKEVKVFGYDAEKVLPFEDSVFDCVLLDAPCSGTGTIRHNPEIRWHLTPEELKELPAKQLKILRNAAKTVKRKGRLIYSTCALEPEENEVVIAEFLLRNPSFENITAHYNKQFLTKDNFVRTFPHQHNLDGFFIAVLRRFR